MAKDRDCDWERFYHLPPWLQQKRKVPQHFTSFLPEGPCQSDKDLDYIHFLLIFPKRCGNSKDSHRTVFHKVNYSTRVKFPQHLKRFEVTMFTFIEGTTQLQKQVRYLWLPVQ